MARILVVEDDPWSQRIVIELLEMRGHDVLAAGDVSTARAELAKAPQLVLLDIHIPGGGGETLLKEIRGNAASSALPVIALTASAMSGDRERFLKQGFTAYMSKPIDVKSFGPTIEHYVRQQETP
jgi:CheY-like chemotaxis protein